MANNDPIKEYNPMQLRIDHLAEKFEMYTEKEDAVTDLHDCSNDLSEKGSIKEEYEHAKYAENIRKNKKNSIQQGNYTNKISGSNVISIIGIIIIISIIFNVMRTVMQAIEYIFDEEIMYEDFLIEEEKELEDESEKEKFKNYVENIGVIVEKIDSETYCINVFNNNFEDYENLNFVFSFYNKNGECIRKEQKNIKMLRIDLSRFEIKEMLEEYDSFDLEIFNANGDSIKTYEKEEMSDEIF